MDLLLLGEIVWIVGNISQQKKLGHIERWQGVDLKAQMLGEPPRSHFYLSSLLVSLVNKITSSSSSGGWLSDNDFNKDRLDLFYWLLAALGLINFFNYLFCSKWYSYNPSLSSTTPPQDYNKEVRFWLEFIGHTAHSWTIRNAFVKRF